MTTILIRSWRKDALLGSEPFTAASLSQKLETATEIGGNTRERLVRRILAGCSASISLRHETDHKEITAWLTQAGAEVTIRPPTPI